MPLHTGCSEWDITVQAKLGVNGQITPGESGNHTSTPSAISPQRIVTPHNSTRTQNSAIQYGIMSHQNTICPRPGCMTKAGCWIGADGRPPTITLMIQRERGAPTWKSLQIVTMPIKDNWLLVIPHDRYNETVQNDGRTAQARTQIQC